MTIDVPINNFKTDCYKLSQKVSEENIELILTKHGKPLVRVLPLQSNAAGRTNALKGTAVMKDDLVEPIKTLWLNDQEEIL